MVSGHNSYTRAYCGAIAFCSDKFNFDPILFIATVVTEKGRQVTHVENQNVNVTVVVIIPEGGAATGKTLSYSWTHRGRHILEFSIAHVLVYEARVLVSLSDIVAINFWINVPINLKDVGPAIVIEIDESTSPCNVLIIDS